jgi:hypothetical protein
MKWFWTLFIVTLFIVTLFCVSRVQATCTIEWDNSTTDIQVGSPPQQVTIIPDYTLIYISVNPNLLQVDPNSLKAEVPYSQTSIDCSVVGLTNGMYIAVAHKCVNPLYYCGDANSPLISPIGNVVQFIEDLTRKKILWLLIGG